jgi:hypothetical protein
MPGNDRDSALTSPTPLTPADTCREVRRGPSGRPYNAKTPGFPGVFDVSLFSPFISPRVGGVSYRAEGGDKIGPPEGARESVNVPCHAASRGPDVKLNNRPLVRQPEYLLVDRHYHDVI